MPQPVMPLKKLNRRTDILLTDQLVSGNIKLSSIHCPEGLF
jgi:hypothetical protein